MASPDEIRAGGAAIEFHADLSKLENELKDSSGILQSLNQSFGRSSEFGQFFRLFTGTGALFGLGLASREAAHLGSEIKKSVEELAAGKITGGEFAEKLFSSIPIVGNLYKGFKDIADAIDGSAAAAAKFKSEMAEIARLEKDILAATADSSKGGTFLGGLKKDVSLGGKTGAEKTYQEGLNAYAEDQKHIQEMKDDRAKLESDRRGIQSRITAGSGAKSDDYTNRDLADKAIAKANERIAEAEKLAIQKRQQAIEKAYEESEKTAAEHGQKLDAERKKQQEALDKADSEANAAIHKTISGLGDIGGALEKFGDQTKENAELESEMKLQSEEAVRENEKAAKDAMRITSQFFSRGTFNPLATQSLQESSKGATRDTAEILTILRRIAPGAALQTKDVNLAFK